MEAWQIPIITGALEFLYDVGRGLLEEIRARRKAVSPISEDPKIDVILRDLAILPKDTALQTAVNETVLANSMEGIASLLRLSNIYSKNYTLAREKAAMWGPGLIPPIVVHELADAESNLLDTTERLHRAVKGVIVPTRR